jgi:hypothetical protein
VHAAGRGWLTPAALAAVHEAVRAS